MGFRIEKITLVDALVESLDSVRAKLLSVTLRFQFLRALYAQTHYRLAVAMLISTIFYLPIAFFRPDLLLAFGPLLFGYPHLVASYRFTSLSKKYTLFAGVTLIAIALHLIDPGMTPFGVWQMVVATLTFLIAGLFSKSMTLNKATSAIVLCAAMIALAWREPIMYVGGILIVHNWVAFVYWYRASKTKARKRTVIISSALFLLIHFIVLAGMLDHWIPSEFIGNTQTTAWYLASWTPNKTVWYQMLVLYTFGLSIHYFVWLKAIPESKSPFEHPNSIRVVFKNLKNELGRKALLITALIALAGVIIWLLSSQLGNRIYFEIAILHGALELIYLAEALQLSTKQDHAIGDLEAS